MPQLRKERKKFGKYIYSCIGLNLSASHLSEVLKYAHARYLHVRIVRSYITATHDGIRGYDIQPISVWVHGKKWVKK
jgi:hypothetical protein